MDLQEYQQLTHQFAEYPEEKAIEYLSLKLISELCEYVKVARGTLTVRIETEAQDLIEKLKKEIGDCFWYLSEFYSLLNHELDGLAIEEDIDLFDSIERLSSLVGKYIRKDYGKEKLYEKLYPLLQELVNCLLYQVENLEVPTSEILQANIDKLTSRKERGVIKGDGDDR